MKSKTDWDRTSIPKKVGRRVISLCIILIGLPFTGNAQKYEILDLPKYKDVFFYNGSHMLATDGEEYKKVQSAVFQFCKKRISFRIDSTAKFQSCRKYTRMATGASPEGMAAYKKYKLCYRYFVNFKAGGGILYRCSFTLDTGLVVRDHSTWLLRDGSDALVWKLRQWKDVVKGAKAYQKGFIKPIDTIYLEYSVKHNTYVYRVTQGRNSKTKMVKDTPTSRTFTLNEILVDATSGKVIDAYKRDAVMQYVPSR